jgi:hypothetical protein
MQFRSAQTQNVEAMVRRAQRRATLQKALQSAKSTSLPAYAAERWARQAAAREARS